MHAYTLKEPYGVVGLIFPWNGPDLQRVRQARARARRRLQQRRQTRRGDPTLGLLLDRLIHEAGVPEGVVNLLTGYGHTAGAAITAHPDVEKVAFTGSTEVGKEIVRASAGNLKKVMLELGGKSPVLIFDDADLNMAIFMASMGIFIHSGQGCVCGSRIFVQRGVYDQVVEGIAGVANSMKLGGPDEEGCMSGPLISQKQLTRVMGFIDEGKTDGVEVVTGGHRLDRKGYFVHPTVLTNVDPATCGCTSRRSSGRSSPSCRSTTTTKPSRWPTTPPTAGRHRVDQQPQPRPSARQAAAGRHRNDQLPVGLRPRGAVRRLQAVRLGPRVRPGRHRGLPEDEVGLGPALGFPH